MRIQPTKDSLHILLDHPIDLWILHQIPVQADPADVKEAKERLFPSPFSPDQEPHGTTVEDWEEIILPEMREEFQASLKTVIHGLSRTRKLTPEENAASRKADIGEFDDELSPSADDYPEADESALADAVAHTGTPAELSDTYLIEIPYEHAMDWYSAMNQARLVMAEKKVMVDGKGTVHGPAELQMCYELYTYLQQFLIELVLDH